MSFGQVKVIISGGFSPAYRELLPEFERTTGITVTTASGASQGSGPNTIGAQLRRGVPADVVIMSIEGLADLKAEGKILAGSDIDLAETPIRQQQNSHSPKVHGSWNASPNVLIDHGGLPPSSAKLPGNI